MSNSFARTLSSSFTPTGLNSSPTPTPSALELDCCVVPVRNNFKLIQTTDFFYPLIDDPYTMGWITCCNVLSDLYAMGVVNCDNMLLLLGVAQGMTATEREVCVKLLMEGFRDCAAEANTCIRGGQTVLSPWLMIGGVATSVCSDSEYIIKCSTSIDYVGWGMCRACHPIGCRGERCFPRRVVDRKRSWAVKVRAEIRV
ncbi:unnamed protein product [Echinostoma caproni]|uniref:AIRS domain-containing protein n=1 Tax=Echinostoma caproni TaxID=27848 RepID=A0A183BDA1_9TREM|nr:unnamed protein product [Echinostoma caproni]